VTRAGYRIGCDVGGTFTDLICVTPDSEVVLDKTPSTPEDQSIGVMRGIQQLADRFGLDLGDLCRNIDVVVHGTTTADNTMIEMDGAPTGLLVTKGHRDEIEMRRVHKEAIWDPSYPAPPPIARRRARIPISERCAYDGKVLLPLDENAVRAGIRRLEQLGCTSVAVMYLFSFVNPVHERRTLELIQEEYPDVEHVSLSHEVMAAGPEFERVSTTLVNAYVAPRIARYTSHLVEQLRAAGYAGQVLIMQATGGVMPPDYVANRAVTLLGSGPTGGVMGSAIAARAAGASDFIAVDMGGTSFDMCLVRGGRPEVRTDRTWRYRYYIGIPMVDVRSIGAGGGSIARVRQGALLVGPESAGSVPGPACYGRGGTDATVTDAACVLGYLPTEGFAGGRMTLDADASRAAIERDVAAPLGIDLVEAAWGIERIVNANMANAMRRVLSSYGADPRELAVIAYGGNGPVHACALATELGSRRVLVPKTAPAFSALGLLVADYVLDLVRSYVVPISLVDIDRVRALMTELVDETTKELAPAGIDHGSIATELSLQMAYSGQNSDMSVPVPEGTSLDANGLLDLTQRFHDLHESDRGFAFRNQQPQVRGVRLTARAVTEKPNHLAELGSVTDVDSARKPSREVYWGTEYVATPVYDGVVLGPGASVRGPALVEEPFTVVAVAPGWTCTLGGHGSYELQPAVD
jgi:N-methylhydantoinase A